MHAHIGKLMLPSCAASPRLGANAATIVAGAPTTTPAAAARPMLLCIDKPDKLMTIFVMMPPPTPAKPETNPIATPDGFIGNGQPVGVPEPSSLALLGAGITAFQENEIAGTFASLAMALNGIATAALVPLIVSFL